MICSFPTCVNSIHAKGLCMTHYAQQRRGKPLTPKRDRGRVRKVAERKFKYAPCLVNGCDEIAPRDLCLKHRTYRSRMRATTDFIVNLFSTSDCDICEAPVQGREMHVDHDHTCCPSRPGHTGCMKCVRGILCRECNLALGLVRENPAVLTAMIAYLTKRSTYDRL